MHFEATPERIAFVEARLPQWALTNEVGRFRIPMSLGDYFAGDAASALRPASIWDTPLDYVKHTPGVHVVAAEPFEGKNKRLVLWSDGVATQGDFWDDVAKDAYNLAKGYTHGRGYEGFPAVPAYDVPGVGSKDAIALTKIALRQNEWREEKRYEILSRVSQISNRQPLDSSSKGGAGGGSATTLERLDCQNDDGSTLHLYEVSWEWGYMGEDGDAGEETELFEEESTARASFAEFAAR